MSRVRIPFPALPRFAGARGHSVIAPNVPIKYTSSLKWPRRPQSHQVAGFCFYGMATYPSGKGEVCKTFMHRFESDRRLYDAWPPQRFICFLQSGYCGVVGNVRVTQHGLMLHCRGGGIGRRTGLKILRAARSVWVQVPSSVRRLGFKGRLAQLVRALP